MAEQEENISQQLPTEEKITSKKGINPKVFIIGLPIFIIQLVAVYFITANVLLSRMDSASAKSKSGEKKKTEVNSEGKYIYSVDDVIVNPAGTDGKKLLLSSVGFGVSSEESLNELKSKEIVVKDLIISVLSSRNIEQLSSSNYKDSLRIEIAGRLRKSIPDVKINNVYFSKYILQ